jgi:S-DNA-T family DNA segregation ATPase FtsK/SpoIIIE
MGVRSTLSRRVSEVVGVALFASALLWLVALASYDPTDPVWYFTTGSGAPSNFAGRVGAFLSELSFQLFGYGSYLLPALIVIVGWHYFWCRAIAAVYTKMVGTLLALACTSAFMTLALGTATVGNRPFRAGGYLGEFAAGVLTEYLSRTGSVIVILSLLVVAIILSTQFCSPRWR